MFKTPQIPVKNTACIHMTWNILTFQKENNNILKTESVFEKGRFFSSNCKPFAWKMHLTLQKAAWEAKNAICVKKICKQQKQYQNYALGFASNLHRDKTNQTFWTSKCTKPAQGQKNKSFELQCAPNLHRDKQTKTQVAEVRFLEPQMFLRHWVRCVQTLEILLKVK